MTSLSLMPKASCRKESVPFSHNHFEGPKSFAFSKNNAYIHDKGLFSHNNTNAKIGEQGLTITHEECLEANNKVTCRGRCPRLSEAILCTRGVLSNHKTTRDLVTSGRVDSPVDTQ